MVGPEARPSRREVVEHGGAVALVPVTPDGSVVMVRQFRYAAGVELLEVPAGTLEPGETPEACARRELGEETGYSARQLLPLGWFYTSPGFCSEVIHLYLALVHPTALAPCPDQEEDLVVQLVPLTEAVAMAADGRLLDAKSIAGILMAAARLGTGAGAGAR